MKFEATLLPGVFIIEHNVHEDLRGAFVKTFQKEEFSKMGLELNSVKATIVARKQMSSEACISKQRPMTIQN